MAEEFEVDNKVRIIKGEYKGKTGQIVGKSQIPWEAWKREEGKGITWKESQTVSFWDVELDDTGEIISFPEDDLEKI